MTEYPIGFAIHQMKRTAEFRDIIVAPAGHTLVEFDASGQEFRWMAIASGDSTMLTLCQEGEDPHSFMGARVNPVYGYRELMERAKRKEPEAEAIRQLGKVDNLALQYRTSWQKLRVVARVNYNIPMTEEEARLHHGFYPKTYPEVPKYWEKQIAQTKNLGYVETLAGRRVTVKGDWKGRMGWSMGSTAINFRIQGTGADQKYLALSVLRNYLLEMDARFLFDLHDGLYFSVPDAKVSAFVATAKRMLDNLPYEAAWGFTPPIPMPWDCKAGKSWGTMKGVK